MNITEFLEARIADDEARANYYGSLALGTSRVLAECAVKRSLMELYEDEWELHIQLASVYSDHPDYQQEWAL